MHQRSIGWVKRGDRRISSRISRVNRGGSVVNKVAILEDQMSFLGHNVGVAKDNSRNSVNKRRYAASSAELRKADK